MWYVAVVHRFHVAPTLLEVMSTSLSASAVTGTTVAAGVQLASWLALSFVFFTLVVRVCGLASQCHTRTDAKEMSAVPEAVFASTNKHASGALIRKKCAA